MRNIILLNSLLKRVASAGALEAGQRSKVRSIQLTNAIALITASLFCMLVTYLVIKNGWSIVGQVGLITIVALLSVVMLNYLQLYDLSRGLMCIIIPFAVVAAIFLPRMTMIGQYNYFRSPDVYAILITSSIIPLLIFSLRERRELAGGILINLLILLFFDYGLYRFSSSYAQAPYTFLRLISSNLILLIMYLFLAGSIAFLRNLFEYFEIKNDELIHRLHQKNKELHDSNLELYELNQNIEVQNEEIQSQSEEILQSQESIVLANIEIERQKKELEEKNYLLEESLGQRNIDLLQTNQQLVDQNSDLQQFSFTVSHNLRAPVASLKGLINLYHMSKTEEEKAHLIQLFEVSTGSLDTIIQDLGKIVDIRHDSFTAIEKVCLQTEMDMIIQSLKTFIVSNEVSLQTEFHCPEIVSIKAYINSILFNLVSNAIKYRSPTRKPIVRISSRSMGDSVILEVSDNGLGIDLPKHQGDLFKLYKRFHSHTPGKGLGLFIVKQQIEKLNATIEVESEPEQGTTFRIYHHRILDLMKTGN